MNMIRKKAAKADLSELPKASTNAETLRRYFGLIVSIFIFLVGIGGLMLWSIRTSGKIQDDTEQLYVATRWQASHLQMVSLLQNLKLNYGKDPRSPYVTTTVKRLRTAKQEFSESLMAVKDGGQFTDSVTGEVFVIDPLEKRGKKERIARIAEVWTPISGLIEEYLKVSSDPLASSDKLDGAVLRMEAAESDFTRVINFVVEDVEKKMQRRSQRLSTYQRIGVAASIAYFFLFLFFFIRRLFNADREIQAARQETTEIMDTVTTGLFLLDKDLTIGSQYSKQLESLIGETNISGKNLLDVLGNLIDEEDLNTTNQFIGQLYNSRTKERLISSLNPLIRKKVHVDDKDRYLNFNFRRVYHGKEITRVLVNVEDVTDAVLLEEKMEQEREQNDIQLEMLSTILQADRGMINDFVKNTKQHIDNINNTLKEKEDSSSALRDKVDRIYREVHSLKGEASALKLSGFTNMAENFEVSLNRLKQLPKISGENFLGLTVQLEELIRLNQTISDLVVRIGEGKILPDTAGTASESPQAAGSRYAAFVNDIAARNQKQAAFSYTGLEKTGHEKVDGVINEIAIQLLRNAVVHGIETPEVRIQRSKLPVGLIHMSLQEQNGQYLLTFEDDGNGIDYKAIADKAVRLGKYTPEQAAQLDKRALIALLFSPGFSTMDKSTMDAGRGVGLDIIKDRVVALGGSVNVASKTHAYTRFSFTLPKRY